MTRLTRIFLATTIALSLFSAAMVCAVIQEAKDRSAAVEEVYKIGLLDGEAYTKDAVAREAAERELIEDQAAHIAEEKL